jgi:hypothetical protein
MDYILDVESFSYLSRTIGYLAGGFVMWFVGRGLPKKYNLEGKDLSQELLDTVNEFADAGVPCFLQRCPSSFRVWSWCLARSRYHCVVKCCMSYINLIC